LVKENGMITGGLMTIEDVAEYLKVTRRTIYEWLRHDKIPAIKLIGQWRFKKERIDAWIDSRKETHVF
jgi:excisionase family DNA binding protein